MKRWKLALGLAAISAAALVLVGRTNARRFRESHTL